MPFTPGAERPSGSVCEQWATTDDVCAPCDEIDAVLLDSMLEAASLILYELTGRRWPGECEEVVYPTSEECLSWLGIGAFRPGQDASWPTAWMGWPSYPHRNRRRGIRLPGYPVTSIEQVVINGEVVDPSLYRVDDDRWLIYIPPVPLSVGDRQNWPIINDERLALGSDFTWSVDYWYGNGPPPGGREAAAALGCEMAKSCSPEVAGECRLPARISSITRQGVTMAILDPLTLFSDGLTGLPEVDMWVAAMRLGVKRRPASIVVPGKRRPVQRRGTTTS